jgi:hypothetical protein
MNPSGLSKRWDSYDNRDAGHAGKPGELLVRHSGQLVPSEGGFIPNLFRGRAKPPTLDANIWRRLRVTLNVIDGRMPDQRI